VRLEEEAMRGKFRMADETGRENFDWGSGRWMSSPKSTDAKQITTLEGTIIPGQGHPFHRHASQEEVLYVLSGEVEQWIDSEKRTMKAGDAAFIPSGVVHATFNDTKSDAKVYVTFSPCVGDFGFESIDVSGEMPWKELRK
jgi:quercetin dioxygenase-like cupin family protein